MIIFSLYPLFPGSRCCSFKQCSHMEGDCTADEECENGGEKSDDSSFFYQSLFQVLFVLPMFVLLEPCGTVRTSVVRRDVPQHIPAKMDWYVEREG